MSAFDGYQTVRSQQQNCHCESTSNDQLGRSPNDSSQFFEDLFQLPESPPMFPAEPTDDFTGQFTDFWEQDLPEQEVQEVQEVQEQAIVQHQQTLSTPSNPCNRPRDGQDIVRDSSRPENTPSTSDSFALQSSMCAAVKMMESEIQHEVRRKERELKEERLKVQLELLRSNASRKAD